MMKEVSRERGPLDAWLKFVTGQAPMDWHALFRRFEGTVDMPGRLYYKELLQAFPDAKVVLTVRDPDRWYASFVALYRSVNRVRRLGRVIPKLGKMDRFADALLEKMFAGSLDRATCIRVFNEHNEAVQLLLRPRHRSLLSAVPAGPRAALARTRRRPRRGASHARLRPRPRGGLPDPTAPLGSVVRRTKGRFGRVPRVFVTTEHDRAIPLAFQQQMIAASPPTQMRSSQSSHSPFLSMPRCLADVLSDL
jgi:hypothetical protein